MQKISLTFVHQQLINNYFKMQEHYYLLFGARGQIIKMQISPGFKQKSHESRVSTSSYQTPNSEKIKTCELKTLVQFSHGEFKIYLFMSKPIL